MDTQLTGVRVEPRFRTGQLVRHRASKRLAVVLNSWLDDDAGPRYRVEFDFFGADVTCSCECGELVIESAEDWHHADCLQ